MDNLVVILILAHKKDLTDAEKASLHQCCNVLNKYPIKVICPQNLDVSEYLKICPTIEIDFIDPKWQINYRMFNRLKIHPFLYRRYQKYRFILFYELDAWVFNDALRHWCAQDYDYIGAPWYEGFHAANSRSKFIGVGNGGFSLRKTKSMLKAITNFSYLEPPIKLSRETLKQGRFSIKKLLTILTYFTVGNNTFYIFNDYQANEDFFWGNVVARNFRWFKLPAENIALQFSMEVNAPELIEYNNFRVPFGCHAWEKYNRNFWEQYIDINNFKI
jgi:hypothetical protein